MSYLPIILDLQFNTITVGNKTNLIKVFSIRLLGFLGLFSLFTKFRQIFLDFWFWVDSNKLKEFYRAYLEPA